MLGRPRARWSGRLRRALLRRALGALLVSHVLEAAPPAPGRVEPRVGGAQRQAQPNAWGRGAAPEPLEGLAVRSAPVAGGLRRPRGPGRRGPRGRRRPVSYTHLRAHETGAYL
eukprot:9046688-Pyramimonas_sp.AAC.1